MAQPAPTGALRPATAGTARARVVSSLRLLAFRLALLALIGVVIWFGTHLVLHEVLAGISRQAH